MSRDFRCSVKGNERNVEYLVVQRHGLEVIGEVPRACVEALGVDCSVLDRNRGRPKWERGAIFFSSEQADALHGHRHFHSSPEPSP